MPEAEGFWKISQGGEAHGSYRSIEGRMEGQEGG